MPNHAEWVLSPILPRRDWSLRKTRVTKESGDLVIGPSGDLTAAINWVRVGRTLLSDAFD